MKKKREEKDGTANPARFMLRVPFLGDGNAAYLRQKTKATLSKAFPITRIQFIFLTSRLHSLNFKTPLPNSLRCNLVYRYKCLCGAEYLGHTGRSLGDRIAEHRSRSSSSINEHCTKEDSCSFDSNGFQNVYSPRVHGKIYSFSAKFRLVQESQGPRPVC
ncbi:hypothetical protein Ciccas_001237 [Cichlidogyrus casuarinus]|uniref:GIY-YIG domain-containing protein n=1 Tax=Cichlidogyrus casuarinus TaxID=1844966 RepID=A0ABD2QKK9_9PLAT